MRARHVSTSAGGHRSAHRATRVPAVADDAVDAGGTPLSLGRAFTPATRRTPHGGSRV